MRIEMRDEGEKGVEGYIKRIIIIIRREITNDRVGNDLNRGRGGRKGTRIMGHSCTVSTSSKGDQGINNNFGIRREIGNNGNYIVISTTN
jgi:hypothetical protein